MVVRDESLSPPSADLGPLVPVPDRLTVAQWRRRPEDPRHALGWIMWGDRHMSRQQRVGFFKVMLACAAAIALFTVVLGGAVLIIGPLIAWLLLALYARPGAREHAQLPELGGDTAFPVTLDLWSHGRKVGRENGWVAFADGWLVYEGLRTNFSVRMSDIHLGAPQTGSLTIWYPDKGAARLTLLTDFMQTNRPAKMGASRDLDRAVAAWRAGPSPAGQPFFPPQTQSARHLGERIAETGALTFFFLLMTVLSGFGGMVFVALACAAIAAFWCSLAMRSLKTLKQTLNR